MEGILFKTEISKLSIPYSQISSIRHYQKMF